MSDCPGRAARVFAWRRPLLDAQRLDPHISRACKAAGISRNSMYAHLRRYPVFRRQWERAVDQGRDVAYNAHPELLRADTGFQRKMQRAQREYQAAIEYLARQ